MINSVPMSSASRGHSRHEFSRLRSSPKSDSPAEYIRMRKNSQYMAVVAFLAALVMVGMIATERDYTSQPITRRVLTDEHVDHDTAIYAATADFLDDFDQRRRRAADLPNGTIFTEPAHTRMCRTIIDRLDQFDAGVTTFPQDIFTESEYICRDPDSPYTSMMSMFAAQLLHTANNDIGLNVDYSHRCAKWGEIYLTNLLISFSGSFAYNRNLDHSPTIINLNTEKFSSGNLTTIQFHLPDPLSTNAHAFQPGCIDAPVLRTLCSGCLASDDPTNPDCLLFPDGYLTTQTSTCNLGCYFRQVLPWIRNNIRIVAQNWLSTVEERALTFWTRKAAEFSQREKDDMEVSVISLSCANDECAMSQSSCTCEFSPLPNWVYAMHIPRSSTNVAIMISPTCFKFGEGCELHAQELYHFLHQLYPRADITSNVITSTSSWYMRMIMADHLICPPGVGCLLPAITRDAYTYIYDETANHTAKTWLSCTPPNYLSRLKIHEFPPTFVQDDCRHLRGRVGAWKSDLSLANNMQYTNPVDGYLGCADENFSPSALSLFRKPTTYRWNENIWATCPINLVTKVSAYVNLYLGIMKYTEYLTLMHTHPLTYLSRDFCAVK